jgi:enamine deaminase RidA (YjgF/YER057c/UK114 family)
MISGLCLRGLGARIYGLQHAGQHPMVDGSPGLWRDSVSLSWTHLVSLARMSRRIAYAATGLTYPGNAEDLVPSLSLSHRLEESVKKIIYNPLNLEEPVGHFERAVRLGDWLFVSGTSALTNVSGSMSDRHLVQGIEAQTRETLDNIEKVLIAAGGTWESVYEMRIILNKREDFPAVDHILRECIPQKGFICHAYQGNLLHPEMELEIEVNAYLGLTEVERVGRG